MGDRNPNEVLEYILQHKGSIIKVLQSVQKARDARAHCKKYVLCVKEPPEFCDPESPCETLIVPGKHILQYVESCKESCPEHEFVYNVLKHASFFMKVFHSVELARKAFAECKEYCACIKIPPELKETIFECVDGNCFTICKKDFRCKC